MTQSTLGPNLACLEHSDWASHTSSKTIQNWYHRYLLDLFRQIPGKPPKTLGFPGRPSAAIFRFKTSPPSWGWVEKLCYESFHVLPCLEGRTSTTTMTRWNMMKPIIGCWPVGKRWLNLFLLFFSVGLGNLRENLREKWLSGYSFLGFTTYCLTLLSITGWWYLPPWKIWVRQLGWLFPIYGKS